MRVTIEQDAEERAVDIPGDLEAALNRDPIGRAMFQSMSYTPPQKAREIEGAKRPETRQRRIEKTLVMRDKTGN